MPDHVHLLLTAMRNTEGHDYELAALMKAIKGASAHSVNRLRSATGTVWQRDSFNRVLRGRESIRKTAEYICQNPVRAGLVAEHEDYPWLWREWVEGLES